MLIDENKVLDSKIRVSLLELSAFCLRMVARHQSDAPSNFTVKLSPAERELEAARYMQEYEFFYGNAQKFE